MALFQGIRIGIGFKKQAALQTPLVAADMWSLRNTNQDVPQPVLNNESDAADLGKGVYATQLFKSHADTSFPLNGFLTSEWAALLACFALGKTTKTAAGTGFKYTCTAPNFNSDPLDMPSTTIAVKIPDGGGAVTDKALIGMCCEEFGIQINSGTGRQNAQFTSSWVGCGAWANPSTITIPALTTEHSLNAGGLATLTAISIDYLAGARFVSATFSWKNNIRLDSGNYPGSGQQSGYQIRGRMRRGVPTIGASLVVEAVSGSAEEDNLLNQTEGTLVMLVNGAVIGAGPEVHSLKLTLHRAVPKATQIGQNDNIATYQIDLEVLEHASNGVLTIEAVTTKDALLTAAS